MDAAELEAIDEVLDGAVCWGAELDLRYRVLALTVEPADGRHPDGSDAPDDGRLQLVLHPCNDVQARLLHEGRVLERFDVEQLVMVVDRLDGPTMHAPVVAGRAPKLAGELSLEGRADVVDGRTHVVHVELRGHDRLLVLRAGFDTVELRRPDGSTIQGLGG